MIDPTFISWGLAIPQVFLICVVLGAVVWMHRRKPEMWKAFCTEAKQPGSIPFFVVYGLGAIAITLVALVVAIWLR